jgi:hypothetical protein
MLSVRPRRFDGVGWSEDAGQLALLARDSFHLPVVSNKYMRKRPAIWPKKIRKLPDGENALG